MSSTPSKEAAAPQIIYGDEAGFTGNNLLDDRQPFFAYATVAMEPEEAAELVSRTVRDFRIQGAELKGSRLLNWNGGRRAALSVLNACREKALVMVYHKRYTIATKFFEHIFEPILAEKNSIFYNSGFHRWISNILYVEALGDNRRVVDALEAFQRMMRREDEGKIDVIFPPLGISQSSSDILHEIETFAICHRDALEKDMASYGAEHSLYRWMLDVSWASLFNLLQVWGDKFESVRVFCDESKPISENREHFDIMIGRTERTYFLLEGKRQPLIFNLAEPLNFVRSHEHPGIQIADVVAASAAFVFRNLDDPAIADFKAPLLPLLFRPVMPDIDDVDPSQPQALVNRLVLRSLVDRTLRQEDLFEGMPEFIAAATEEASDPAFLARWRESGSDLSI